MTNLKFSELPLASEMLKTLDSLNYHEMTPIQAAALPVILENKDMIAQAETGSGKTAAFGVGVLSKLDVSQKHIQSLILCPTRELADQVSEEIRRLARLMPNVRILSLYGGKAIKTQELRIEHGAHIIVGTPGRILDHTLRGNLDFSHMSTLILDEADRMLEMGFEEDLHKIIDHTPANKQTLLFSATFPDEIERVGESLLNEPQHVKVAPTATESNITQVGFKIEKGERDSTLLALLKHYKPESTIVFCNTKAACNEVESFLREAGFYAMAMHGDFEQKERNNILIQFANKSCPILVATDVAARGLDISKLDAVINYDVANSVETHMHRIGRTGRAGQSGLALSMYMPYEKDRIEMIEDFMRMPIKRETVESIAFDKNYQPKPKMRTLCIAGGKKQKLRPGDIVGALTGELGLLADQLGKININDFYSYVAVQHDLAKKACSFLNGSKIKNRKFKVQLLT